MPGSTLREALDALEAAAAAVDEARVDTDAFPLTDKEKQDALFVMLHKYFRAVEEDVYCAKEDDTYRFPTYEAAHTFVRLRGSATAMQPGGMGSATQQARSGTPATLYYASTPAPQQWAPVAPPGAPAQPHWAQQWVPAPQQRPTLAGRQQRTDRLQRGARLPVMQQGGDYNCYAFTNWG
ncbi:unnamed protein product, partial [Phaeothamnion confervicola]